MLCFDKYSIMHSEIKNINTYGRLFFVVIFFWGAKTDNNSENNIKKPMLWYNGPSSCKLFLR